MTARSLAARHHHRPDHQAGTSSLRLPPTIDRDATECQKLSASEASHLGDIISEHWARSSRNARATSSESAARFHPRPVECPGSGEAGRCRLPFAQGCMVRHHYSSWGADVDGPRRPRRIRENAHQGPDRGRPGAGQGTGRAVRTPLKLSPHQRREALAQLDAGDSVVEVARTFGVDRATLYRMRAEAAQ
jgi:hypothetical protein